jgi:hypothetical protein
MIIEYESQSIFRPGKSNSASEYDTTPSEYDFIKKVLLTTVWTNEIAAISRSYNNVIYTFSYLNISMKHESCH